jgi:hypothetical protein
MDRSLNNGDTSVASMIVKATGLKNSPGQSGDKNSWIGLEGIIELTCSGNGDGNRFRVDALHALVPQVFYIFFPKGLIALPSGMWARPEEF